MSELQNPIFDEEKEFLERKKLEYERALRGDVDHIKDQSVKVGKVALVGAGLAGSVWLITKAFGSKKHRHDADDDHGHHDQDDRAPRGKREQESKKSSAKKSKSAAASAMVFMDHYDSPDHEFGGGVAPVVPAASMPKSAPRVAQPVGPLGAGAPNKAQQPAAPAPQPDRQSPPLARPKHPTRPCPSRPPRPRATKTTPSANCRMTTAAGCRPRTPLMSRPRKKRSRTR